MQRHLCSNLYQIWHTSMLYLHKIFFETYTRYDLYFKAITDSSWIQRKFCFKCTLDITYTSNQISKKSFLATIISTLKKATQFSYKNTTPGEQKGEAIVFSVQQLLNLILYRSNVYIYISRYCIDLYNINVRGQCYVKAIEVEPS